MITSNIIVIIIIVITSTVINVAILIIVISITVIITNITQPHKRVCVRRQAPRAIPLNTSTKIPRHSCGRPA